MDGETLRQARKYLNLSQVEAAELTGVTPVTYARWERGETQPYPFNLRKIEGAFGDALIVQKRSLNQDTEPTVAPLSPMGSMEIITPSKDDDMEIKPNMIDALWTPAFLDHLTVSEKRQMIKQVIKDFDTMNTNDKTYQMTRREAVSSLIKLPMVTLGLNIPDTVLQPKRFGDAIAHCSVALEGCWEAYRSNNDTSLAFQCISKYLSSPLKTIIENSSPYRKEALNLAAQYAILKTLLGWIHAGPAETIPYAKDAVALSNGTEDISLQLSAYSKLAWTYFYNQNYPQALATAQDAEARMMQYQEIKDAEPLHPCVRGGTYSTLALMQARNRKSPDTALGKAMEIDPGNEVHTFMEFTKSILAHEAGLTYCYQGNQEKAMEWLGKRVDPKTLTSKIPQSERLRVRTVSTMALSSLKAKDRDMNKTIYFWIAGIEGAKAIQSETRFADAVSTYELMEVAWPSEKRILNLRDHIVHW